jgi:hypothetical protein
VTLRSWEVADFLAAVFERGYDPRSNTNQKADIIYGEEVVKFRPDE